MSEEPLHNSGAELERRTERELRAELRESFPGGARWQGLTYELSRRASARQERLTRWTLYAALAAVLVGLAPLISRKGVLISQQRVSPGETYIVPGWGDLGKAQQDQLACRYFVGTRVRWQVFWYSPNNVMGRADCPMFLDR